MAKGYQHGASVVGAPDDVVTAPPMTLRDWFALHAPPPPSWWKFRTPLDAASWCWTWADAMLKVRDQPTTPDSAVTPGVNRP